MKSAYRNLRTFCFYVLITFCGTTTFGQYLSIQDAVKIGLSENLSLVAFQNEIEITKTNTGNGAAGMLPTVTANGDVTYSLSNTRQQFLDGRENAIAAGSTFRANAGVGLNWTVFDGMAMYSRRAQLLNEYELASLDLKREAQALSADISITYQNLILQTALINILDENVTYLKDLVALSSAKLEIGSVSKLDVLQAKTDLNELLNARQLAQMEYEIYSAELNRDLNRDASLTFNVDSSFLSYSNILSYQDWTEKALNSNFDIKRSRKAYEIARKDIDLINSESLPTVDFNSSFDVGYLNSNTGFLTSNRSIGPSIGIAVRYNIFDGHRVKRQLQIAELRAQISELTISRVSLETKNEMFILFQRHEYFVKQANLEKENLTLAAENFELANALFRNGGITQYDLRQVRNQRLAIQRRLVQAEYQQVISYIGLMELSGENWL